MQKIALLIIIVIVFVFSAVLQSTLAQEDSASVPEATEQDQLDPQLEEEEAEEEEAEEEEIIVDDEFYQDVDDKDFRPSEDIPADQSIPFPTDI
jgi:uncharacterized membrane protein